MKEFNIEKGDIITITGAGGKTSLMFSLAKKLSNLGKVLVTTTTKIFVPKLEDFEEMKISDKKFKGLGKNIFIYGEKIENNKVYSLSYEEIFQLKEKFDFILIEGDGAKEKKIKAWNDTEPCIPNFSTKVIGVVNLDIKDLELKEENIHRFELFKEKFFDYIGGKVGEEFLTKYIETGDFFKNFFSKEKYIFLNGIDGEKYLEKFSLAMKICNRLKGKYKFILGSVKEDIFFRYKATDAVVMASGYSRRMGENKLKLPYRDTTLLDYNLEKISFYPFYNTYVCGRESWVEELAKLYNFKYLNNEKAELGQSESIKLGVKNSEGEGIVFFTGDQPFLTTESILKLYYNFQRYNYITIPRVEKERFSPVFFPEDKKIELLKLEGDTGGREVIRNASLISFVDFYNSMEFLDIDTPEEYENVISIYFEK